MFLNDENSSAPPFIKPQFRLLFQNSIERTVFNLKVVVDLIVPHEHMHLFDIHTLQFTPRKRAVAIHPIWNEVPIGSNTKLRKLTATIYFPSRFENIFPTHLVWSHPPVNIQKLVNCHVLWNRLRCPIFAMEVDLVEQ